jgi:hypothetical protein
MVMNPNRRTLQIFSVALVSLLLCSCAPVSSFFDSLGHKPAKHAKLSKPQNSFDAEAFAQHLALAKIAAGNEDGEDLEALQAAGSQKNKHSPQLTLLVLEYKTPEAKRLHKIAAPVSRDNDEFPALLEVMDALGTTPYTLHDIHLASTTVTPPAAVDFSGMTSEQIVAWVDQQEQRLQEGAHKLAPLEDAKLQLQLTRFFMANGFRDPAYLAVGNVKQALAAATQNKSADEESIKALSQELDSTENQLHKEMPFGF